MKIQANHQLQKIRRHFHFVGYTYNHKILLVLLLMILGSSFTHAQQDTLSFFQNSQSINNTGMIVLGAWALGNITSGAYGMIKGSGSNKYFHQMNFFWNFVNASIASYALYTGFNTDYLSLTNSELLSKQTSTQNLYLINAGLDIFYMGTGAYLIHRSKSAEKRNDLLKGYGQSVILQGGFLFVFDLIMYGIQFKHKAHFLENITTSVGINSFQISINF